MLRYILPLLALAGCTTTVDQAIQKNLPTICKNANTAHAAFSLVAATGRVSDKVVRSEGVAYDNVVKLCAQTGPVDTATVLIAATAAYLEITKALREAERVETIIKAERTQ